jgi:TolB-like protein
LFVIARHTSFAFKNKASDIRRIARELGVRYVLREAPGAPRGASASMRS